MRAREGWTTSRINMCAPLLYATVVLGSMVTASAELQPGVMTELEWTPGACYSGPPGGSPERGGPEISFPPDGAIVEGEALTVKVRDGLGPFTWLANGAPLATTRVRELRIDHLGPGFSSLTVIDAEGRSARASIELR